MYCAKLSQMTKCICRHTRRLFALTINLLNTIEVLNKLLNIHFYSSSS